VACWYPGGLLFFTDYGRGEGEPSAEFSAYINSASTTCNTCTATRIAGAGGFRASEGRGSHGRSSYRSCARSWRASPTTRRTPRSASPGGTRSSARPGEQGWIWCAGEKIDAAERTGLIIRYTATTPTWRRGFCRCPKVVAWRRCGLDHCRSTALKSLFSLRISVRWSIAIITKCGQYPVPQSAVSTRVQ